MKPRAVLLLAPLALLSAAPDLRGPVRIEIGFIEGVGNAEVAAFKGIPYAAPPVGEWRWRELPAAGEHLCAALHGGVRC